MHTVSFDFQLSTILFASKCMYIKNVQFVGVFFLFVYLLKTTEKY